jgi:preprotein translocase subunit SecD
MRGGWNAVVLAVLVVAVGVTGWFFGFKSPIQNYMKLGLDLKGGVHMVLQGVDSDLGPVTDDAMNAAMKVVERRVNGMGTSEPQITREGKDRIVVQVAGVQDTEAARSQLGTTAVLTFVGPDGVTILDGKDIKQAAAAPSQSKGGYEVDLELKGDGTKKFADATTKFVGQQIAIKLDGKDITTPPTVNEPITGGRAQITGNFTAQEATDLANLINGGALPIKMNLIENRVVTATLGAQSLAQSGKAILVGIAAVLLFMLLIYRVPGILADIALAIYVVLTMGILMALNATFTLPGLAGILLGIGMAVDGNIIIFERIKEELRNGKGLRSGIDAGFHRAFAAILDGQVTTAIAGVVLYYMGTGPIKGFAVTLTIGVILSIFTSVTFSRWLIKLLVGTGWFTSKSLFGVKEVAN